MTVTELQTHLSKFPGDLHVYAHDPETGKDRMILRVLHPPVPRRGIQSRRAVGLSDASEIRSRYERILRNEEREPGSHVDIADDYHGISHETVRKILTNETYKEGVIILELAQTDRSMKGRSAVIPDPEFSRGHPGHRVP